MVEGKFNRPEFLKPELQILDKSPGGASPTRKMRLLRELPVSTPPGEEIKTEHYYIKQITIPGEGWGLNLPEYNADKPWASSLADVRAILVKLRQENRPRTAAEVLEEVKKNEFIYKSLTSRLKKGETPIKRVGKCINLLQPETVLRHTKELYERHVHWFNNDIPDFVIPKLFVLGKGEEGEARGYVVKEHVDSTEEVEGVWADLGFLFEHAFSAHDNSEELKSIARPFAERLKKHFSLEQYATLADEFRKFVSISRNIMKEEELVIDVGPAGRKSNIRITPEGHLRMIDTDRVYPLRQGDGRLDTPAMNVGHALTALDFVADELSKSS